MKYFFAIAFFSAAVIAADLPAINTITTSTFVCTIESKNDTGTAMFQCKNKNTAAVGSVFLANVQESPAIFANNELTCIYSVQGTKNHVQCGDNKQLLLEGDLPPVAKTVPWFLFWL